MSKWTLVERSAQLAWRIARWPVNHRRLPNRGDLRRLMQHLRHVLRSRSADDAVTDRYEMWVENNRLTSRAVKLARRQADELTHRPLISVIMPVYNVEARWLERAVESVQAQIYPAWQLCIAEDCATDTHIRPLLKQLASQDERILVRFLDANVGISRASNAAAELATGEFLLFLDQDDELTPDCLLEVAQAIAADPSIDIVYSDDDKIDVHGRRHAPQFKPDWSPELLLSYMYFSHAFAVRRELFKQAGGFQAGFEGSQDYDLALRLTERTQRVAHIPRVLYHWRCLPQSTASSGGAKPAAFERGRRAVQEALDRRGIAAVVSRPEFAKRGNLGLFQLDFPDTGPRVAIIIPTRNRLDLLKRCIESIRKKTAYQNYQIVVIDNDSDNPATLAYLRQLPPRCRVLRLSCPGGRFSYAWLNNEAARLVDADLLLFLNNDTEVRRPEWLGQMVGYASIAGVGAVGARLLFPDSRVQHAGVVVGPFQGLATPAFKCRPDWDGGYLGYALAARNCAAVTAACLLIRRQTFLDVGGFDEQRFAVAYNDVDLCLRLLERGLRCVYAPRAELTHYEGATRRGGDDPNEVIAFRRRWGKFRDPYYNPNLSLEDDVFEIETRRATPPVHAEAPPVRAVFVTHNLGREGAPLSLYELARGLRERGQIEPHVFCHEDGPLRELYRRAGIEVHVGEHPLRERPDLPEFQKRVAELGRWLKRERFDVLFANTLDSFWAIRAARSAGIASLWNIRESCEELRAYYEPLGPWMVEPALRTFNYPYRTIFVAEATRALYAAVNRRHNMSVIRNGLRREAIDQFLRSHDRGETRRQLGFPSDCTVFAILGTVCDRKGQLEFAEAAARLIDSGRRDVLFVIVGCRPSPYQTLLEEFVKDRADFFRLVPTTDKALHYLTAADVFVCCSRNESYPRVILEAMACDVPMITTPVFGIAEQVAHDFSALTYEPGDVETLARHMNVLADRPEERTRLLAGAAKQLQSLTSYPDMVVEYERLIREAALTGDRLATAVESCVPIIEVNQERGTVMSGTETGVR